MGTRRHLGRADEVMNAGGFPLSDKESLTAVRALSMAGGLKSGAKASQARVIHRKPDPAQTTESPIDLKKILAGKAPDVPLKADDVLYVPDSKAKKIAMRTAEAALVTVGGILIFRSQ